MKIKRTLSLLLALVMLLGMMPTVALAAGIEVAESGLPVEVQADLDARGIGSEHVYDYDATTFAIQATKYFDV